MTTTHDLITGQASAAVRALDGHKSLFAALDAHRSFANGTLTGAFGAVQAAERASSVAAFTKATSLALQPTIDHARELFESPAFTAVMRSIEGIKVPHLAGLLTASESVRTVQDQLTAIKFPAAQYLDHLETSRVMAATFGGLTSGLGTPSWVADMQKFRTGLTESLQVTRNFALNDPGLTTALAAFRSVTVVEDSFSRQVTRIGRGWASLTDRALGAYPQLEPLLPPSNRLTSTAFILDIAAATDDLGAGAEELFDTRRENRDPTSEWLTSLSPTLADHWQAMWLRVDERGPAWRSQAAHCAAEFLIELVAMLAPTDQVVEWQIASAKHEKLYSDKGKREPYRRLRLFYLGHVYQLSRYTIDALFMALPDAIKALERVKHTSVDDEQFESLIDLVREVAAILLPNRPR